MLVVWVISLPLTALYLLYKSFNAPGENKTKQNFLIIYQGLKPDRYYWEFVNTLRKVLILGVFVFNDQLKIVLSSLILIVTGRLEIHLKPYKEEENTNTEFIGIFAGVVTILAGLMYTEENPILFLNTLILIIVVVINLSFIYKWSILFFKMYEEKSPIAAFVS